MPFKFVPATVADVPSLTALEVAEAAQMTRGSGPRRPPPPGIEKKVRSRLKNSSVYVARENGRLIVALRLGTKKPRTMDTKYFQPCARPLYFLGVTVAPYRRNVETGLRCMEETARIARERLADALRLDACEENREFYRKCGFKEVGRVVNKTVPLIYFEMLL